MLTSAYFSQKHFDRSGGVVYKSLSGRDVTCTFIDDSDEWVKENYKWDDATFVGFVDCSNFVRRIEK